MASSSSSLRRREKVARVTRNVDPIGWIIDDEVRGKFLRWRKIKIVVPHKYLELVRVFYSNLKISDGTLCSRVKGVDIKLTEEI